MTGNFCHLRGGAKKLYAHQTSAPWGKCTACIEEEFRQQFYPCKRAGIPRWDGNFFSIIFPGKVFSVFLGNNFFDEIKNLIPWKFIIHDPEYSFQSDHVR